MILSPQGMPKGHSNPEEEINVAIVPQLFKDGIDHVSLKQLHKLP
jgi:hypothetical protein